MSVYAVNGKEPVAAWIPSLDTAGNGTTTLTDLVGSNDGTLTNMDAASDWVADTGAGGVRALDFDGINDVVIVPDSSVTKPSTITVSCWVKAATTQTGILLLKRNGRGGSYESYSFSSFGSSYAAVVANQAGTQAVLQSMRVVGQWYHLCLVFSRPEFRFYSDGVLADSTTHDHAIAHSSEPLYLGRNAGAGFQANFPGRIDDVRIWDQALDSTDIAALYASGLGRGITFGTAGNPSGNVNNTIRSMRHVL